MFVAALVDPHPLLRLGLARILGSISSIGEVQAFDTADIDSGLSAAVRGASADILLFGLSGDEPADQRRLEIMLELVAPRHILLLADDPQLAGPRHPLVAGRVRKSAPTDLIEAAVRLILAGGRCFPSGCCLPENASARGAQGQSPADTDAARPGAWPAPAAADPALAWPTPQEIAHGARALRITPRQFEILVLRARGLSMKAVGQLLHISEATVKAHASSMYRRLDVANCQEAVQLAGRKGVHLHAGPPPAAPSQEPDEG